MMAGTGSLTTEAADKMGLASLLNDWRKLSSKAVRRLKVKSMREFLFFLPPLTVLTTAGACVRKWHIRRDVSATFIAEEAFMYKVKKGLKAWMKAWRASIGTFSRYLLRDENGWSTLGG